MDGAHALIVAPIGRDAELAGALLHEIGVPSRPCRDLAQFVALLGEEVAFAVLTEEVIAGADLRALAAWIAAQPNWSDLPFIVLTRVGGGPERNPNAARLLEILGNVTFVERPFHPTTFASVARTAAKGRRRQHEARSYQASLRENKLELESRVRLRTAELEAAHRRAMDEVRQRERAEEQLLQSQKMEAIGQLTGGVAHDFNNLLMAVLGNLEILRKHTLGDARAQHLVEGAMQGARRGASLTQRLLAFSRRQDLQVESVDLVELALGMEDLLRRSIGASIELKFDLPAQQATISGDGNQVELALLNLVVNARDAMPDGGQILIALRPDFGRPADDTLAAGDYWTLSVSDTGTGMPPDTLRRAIEPFFSTKEVGKGTGLGLSMIHGLAIQLHGGLRLASQVGQGTTAALMLPAASPAQKIAVPPAPQGAIDAKASPARILVVDDDVLIAMSTIDMIEDLGHLPVEANSGAEALDLLASGEPFDLLITDYSMPKMTGGQLLTEVRKSFPDLPVIVATGYADLPEETRLDVPRLGKPYDQRQLAEKINAALASRIRNT